MTKPKASANSFAYVDLPDPGGPIIMMPGIFLLDSLLNLNLIILCTANSTRSFGLLKALTSNMKFL